MPDRRPRLAYPFTVLTEPDTVRLVAGEDYRYTLTGPCLEQWLPALLGRMTGGESLAALLGALPPERRDAAAQLVQHLYGERVLVDGPAAAAHVARRYRVIVRGPGVPLPPEVMSGDGPAELVVLCQDALDFDEALRTSRACRDDGVPLLWVSTAPLTRGYVSPLFLPDAGPCFGCLLRSFERLSPAPELYPALRDHARAGRPFTAVAFPAEGLPVLQGIVRWKLAQAEREQPAAGLYRLHVLELETMEVSTHRVFADPGCPECRP